MAVIVTVAATGMGVPVPARSRVRLASQTCFFCLRALCICYLLDGAIHSQGERDFSIGPSCKCPHSLTSVVSLSWSQVSKSVQGRNEYWCRPRVLPQCGRRVFTVCWAPYRKAAGLAARRLVEVSSRGLLVSPTLAGQCSPVSALHLPDSVSLGNHEPLVFNGKIVPFILRLRLIISETERNGNVTVVDS